MATFGIEKMIRIFLKMVVTIFSFNKYNDYGRKNEPATAPQNGY